LQINSARSGQKIRHLAIDAQNGGRNTVTKLLTSNGTVVGTYSIGKVPYAVAFDGTNSWVTNEGSNDVTKIRASSGYVLGTYTVGSVPWGIVYDGANVWVASEGSGTLTMIPAQ